MSSYISEKKFKHPKTGKEQKVFMLDDYFGSHKYGYGFRKDGKDAELGNKITDFDFYKFEELNI